jgi:uncharacterized HAD superfamily protein
MERRLKIYVDIDGTICQTQGSDYENCVPIPEHIAKINKLFDEGHEIVYYTARGQQSRHDYKMLTIKQLHDWNCKYTHLIMNHKPAYDLMICDKTKRIEEI